MKKLIAISSLILLTSFSEVKAQAAACLNFDGTNDFVSVGNVLGASYTKEAWVMITNASLLNHFVSGGTSGQHVLWAPALYSNRLSAGHNGSWNLVQDPTPLSLGVWYHVAVTYDAATTTMRLYKNGVLVSSNLSVPAYTGGNFVRLGSYNGANVMAGNMDEVRIWNTVRTQAQISSNMSCQLTSIPAGLQQYYQFNQGLVAGNNTGITILTDIAGAAQNGTLTNFALTGASSNWMAPGGVPSAVTASLSGSSNVSCNGANDGSASVSASGGSSFTYAWAPSGGTGSSATGLAPGSYTCTVTNQCGQTSTASVTITEPTAVVAAPNVTTPICVGQSTTVNANASGGSPQYTYLWSPGSLTNSSEIISPSVTTVYTVVVTDFSGCTATGTVNVIVNATPTISIVSNPSNGIVCIGGQATLTASGAASYSWTGGVTNGVPFTPSFSSTYTVTGTSAAGCTNTATRSITVSSCSNVTQLIPSQCNLTNASLNTWLYHTAIPGATNYEYRFTNTVTSQVYNRVKGNNQPNMPLSYVAGLAYGQSYYVQVRSYVNSSWTPYGNLTSCTVTMASVPPATNIMASTCGATGITHTSRLYCQGMAGATSYWWTLQRPSYYQGRSSSIANISMGQWAGLLPNTTYTLTVSYYAGGMWSTTSSTCTITIGGVYRLAGPAEEEASADATDVEFNFGVSMYPNPLAQDMNPTVTISGADQKDAVVTVMDLSGRTITTYRLFIEGMDYSTQLAEFPDLVAGMYLMQVQIGDKVQTQKFIAE